MDLLINIKTLFCAMLLGCAFNKLHLAIPCPPTIEGLIGILGLFLGYKLGGLL